MVWSVLLLFGLLGSTLGQDDATHDSIHVATWRWEEVGIFFTFTSFAVLCGLARIAFHHAHWLSSRIPESCLMITVGATVGAIIYCASDPVVGHYVDHLAEMIRSNVAFPKFTPRSFFFILLPPVILEAAYSLYDKAFAENVGTVLLFAVVGTLFNIFAIGGLLYGFFYIGAMGFVPFDLTLIDCLVFSTLIAAVDPVAVLAIFQEIGINKDLYYLVFGESLFNDAVTVVLYSTMVSFQAMPVIHAGQYGIAVLAFLASSLGGSFIGLVYGLLTALVTRTTQQNEIRVVEPLAVLGMAYLSYLSAELFHFSGILSIIACGLVQAHYALKNVSRKSHTTVIYFTKMVSATSEAIIFLFLGIVVVSDAHIWNTGFVLWTLLLCLVCRFAGVYILTAAANLFRYPRINLKEQFILAYGGLRGAIAFSLVQTIEEDAIKPKQLFVTTTLIVIFFTVFVQGSTIKPLVRWLSIKQESSAKRQMSEEINENLFSNVIACIEEITGLRKEHVIKTKMSYLDEKYLQKIFLVAKPACSMTKLNTKLFLTDHFAHLYGAMRLSEPERAGVFRQIAPQQTQDDIDMTEQSLRNETRVDGDIFAMTLILQDGMEMKKRGTFGEKDGLDIKDYETLRRSFRNHPHEKYPGDGSDEHDTHETQAQLLALRHRTATRITELVNRLPDTLQPIGASVQDSSLTTLHCNNSRQ